MYIFDTPNEREPLQSDDQLLARFADRQDQAAFGLIVKRYGSLVQRVCRGVGLHTHDADDVFQATFLVVAQKARLLRRKNHALGAFVHGTAYRFALKDLRFGRRRSWHERAAAKPESSSTTAGPDAQISLQEALSAVDGELHSMPDKYRVPLILYLLEGKLLEDVSRQLRIPLRTIRRRVKDGREILSRRLARRGIQTSIMLFPLLMVTKADAAIAPALAVATAKSAALFVKGSAPKSAATLMASSAASGISKLTGPAKVAATIKLWLSKTAVVVLVGGACAGIVYETRSTSRPANGFGSSSSALPAPMPSGPIVVRGRVLDEEGAPVPLAKVALLAARGIRGERGQHDEVLLQDQADADGAFALEVPQDFPFWVPARSTVKLLASAPDHAPGATAVSLKAGPVSTDIRLGATGAVRGQVVDKDNRPVAGVSVKVVGLGPVGRETIQGSDDPPPAALTGWPQPVLTDHDGRFCLAGLDPRKGIRLEVRDERFGRQLTFLNNRSGPQRGPTLPEKNITIKLAPPQVLEGQVLAADTQKPVPYALLSMIPVEPFEQLALVRHHVDARADAEGRFRMQPLPGGAFRVFACGQDNDPFLIRAQTVSWPQGTMHKELTLTLERGIPVHGLVVEADTGRGVAGTQVEYTEIGAAHGIPRSEIYSINQWWGSGFTHTGADGRFLIPVFPGRGELQVPFDGEEFEMRLLAEGGSGAFVPVLDKVKIEIPANCSGKELPLVLQRWGQLNGQVMDGAGKSVASGALLTAGQFGQNPYRGIRKFDVRDGSFHVARAEVDGAYPIVLIDAAHRQGLLTSLTGKVEDPVAKFALEPCGLAAGILTTRDGSALANVPVDLAVVLSFQPYRSPAEEMETHWYEILNHDVSGRTTSRGKFVLPALVPGARYRLYTGKADTRRMVKEFTVEPGQKLQLGSLVVE